MTLDLHPPQQSVSERRGQRLAPLQTNFSRPTARPVQVPPARPQRPRPTDYQDDAEAGERVPLQPAPVKRQTSKSSLRNIFGREKSARKQANDAKLSGIEEVQQQSTQSASEAAPAVQSPTATATPKTTVSTATLPTSPTTTGSQRSRLPSRSRTRTSDEKPAAGEIGWKPPPLFQAYPQAIKHDCLPVPAMSVDSIMRMHATSKAKAGSREEESQNGESTEDGGARKKKEDKERKRHMRTLSETMNKAEWTQKVYVLATAGYILQYSGVGKYDRLPEKMLQLGPRTVAFASDAIPGKHWVLQVSQTDEDGTDSTKPHRFRFGFHRSHSKRLDRCFLLVFDHPEDMSSWLLAVRAQIEARGGKKYVSEKTADDGSEPQLQTKPSVRQLVTKDPNRFSTMLQFQQTIPGEEKDTGLNDQSRRSSYISVNRRSVVIPPASESRSGSVSTTHTETTSPVSASGRFYSSIAGTSLPKPPLNGSVAAASLDGPSSPTLSSSTKRRSLHVSSPTTTKTAAEIAAEIPRSQSTQPDPVLRSTSPPAPNFSVPSFSKRFTARFGPLQVPQLSQLPPALDDVGSKSTTAALSAFPSPPQSPGKIMNGFPQDDPNEQQQQQQLQQEEQQQQQQQQQWPLHAGQAKRPPLRVSSSQDSLADPQRAADPRSHRLSRMPGGMMANTASQVPRPTTAVSGGPGHGPQLGPDLANARRDQQRTRGSVMYQPDPNVRLPPVAMGRRKSMPGLIGPPAAPPPNCPLPKIPSPIDPQTPNWGEVPAELRQCISPPPLQTIREQRKSLAPSPAGRSFQGRSVSRHSKMPPI
ncbi:peptidase family M20/M25/M40 protein [Aspergillus sclerotioniger CBS 115572]|uniref:Peptidase family M20/M25/M40 protein n=1 Tax=Aspergillus sclerotioniger CBS 115572 TaxID=1450535 RepID=A0A317WUV0_9EURO|nr:peptidase family M20/M25/M40 protein [Aspergillus sclerotioniger CBS 115572]PWY89591.1 peptidase family M20/M25/M40 protein [Aspergillus sclerotioniger CBS 115572]